MKNFTIITSVSTLQDVATILMTERQRNEEGVEAKPGLTGLLKYKVPF